VAVVGLMAALTLGLATLTLLPAGGGPAAPPSAAPAPTASSSPTAAPTPSPDAPASVLPPLAAPPPSTPSPGTPQANTPPATAPPDAVTAVWPPPSSAVRYPGPGAAARGFAVDLVGFHAPVVGPYRSGDARSGEVDVRPEPGGPVTTVFVRRMSDDTWWVLGSATEGIELDAPGAGEVVVSPVVLTGRAWAFEGHVSVRIVQDGSRTPLSTGFVTGGGDALRPFQGSFPLGASTADHGAVVLTTESARDGQVWTAAVVRVGLARP
jgi:hypothetical protein